jgi:hypothetical protein
MAYESCYDVIAYDVIKYIIYEDVPLRLNLGYFSKREVILGFIKGHVKAVINKSMSHKVMSHRNMSNL